MRRALTKHERHLAKLIIPRHVLHVLGLAALFLAPWTAWISYSLPSESLAARWDIAWAGLDIGLLVSLLLTAYFGFRRSGWIVVTAATTGSFLLVDAWFDCLTAKTSWGYALALLSAICFELPLSVLSFWIAYHAGTYYFKPAKQR